ncbi:MAG: tyrosine-type recombinase/integrase [Pseudomonadota bacterium]
MPLTDLRIRAEKPGEKPRKLADGGGLYLLISPSGGKWWRWKYRYGGKEKLLSLGTYPDVSLREAREKRDEARQQLRHGIDPGANRKALKAAEAPEVVDSFEVIAREWFSKNVDTWTKVHADKLQRRLDKDIYPWLGKRPIADITTQELLKTLERIQERGAIDTARRAQQSCAQIFNYAIITGRATHNPATNLRGALRVARQTHHAAIIDPKRVGDLMRAIDAYQGTFVGRSALRLAPLVFVRPGELRHAEWSEIDMKAAEWNIPASKMKMREPHLVPLSRQAVEILEDLHVITGRGKYVFPSNLGGDRPMSENTILAALRNMGFEKTEMSGHGFRAMARTLLDEELGVRVDLIEHQLAHAVRDPNGRAYNRTKHLAERRKMMQAWADYLDELRSRATILPLKKPA